MFKVKKKSFARSQLNDAMRKKNDNDDDDGNEVPK